MELKKNSRNRAFVGAMAAIALIAGAMAAFTVEPAPKALADPYQDLTKAQTSQAHVNAELAGVKSDLKQTILQLNDLVNNQIPAAESNLASAQDAAAKAQEAAQEAGQRLTSAQGDKATLEAKIKQTGLDYDDSKAATAQAARQSFHSSDSSQIVQVVTGSRNSKSFVRNMQADAAVGRVEANKANTSANELNSSMNRKERLKAIEAKVAVLKQQADSASASARAAAAAAQQKADSLDALRTQAEQKQTTLTARKSELTTKASQEAVAVLQAQQAVTAYNKKLEEQRKAEQARAAAYAAQQYNAQLARQRAAAAAAARANAARASSGGSRSYSSGSSAPAPATPSNTVNSSAGASGMNYSVPGNCPATATSCYGHATGRIPGIWGNAYPWSQCTWYAYIRRTQLGLPAGSYLGNGTDWAGRAAALGYYVNNIPHVGAAVSFYPGQAGSAPVYGHVAVVEQVLPGNRILVSECGAVYMGVAHTRILGNASSYRYVHY